MYTHRPSLRNYFQPVEREVQDWKLSYRRIRRENQRNDGYPSVESAKMTFNLMVRIAAYIGTPLAAVASVYLAVAVSLPLSLAGIVAIVLIHETYQVARGIAFDEWTYNRTPYTKMFSRTLVVKHVYHFLNT